VVAAAPRLAAQERKPAFTVHREVNPRRPAGTAPTQPRFAGGPALKLNTAAVPDEIPEVEIRAKDAWTDDQGFRLSATRVAFKSRF
jgi:hypothetical protein